MWVANDTTYIPRMVKTYPNVAIIRRNSAGYRRHLATAKYLINNVTFPSYFAARPGQQYLNTWHGTPLKTLGKTSELASSSTITSPGTSFTQLTS